MAITMQDVARLADVSVKTVSNVVNEHRNIGAETRTRVQAVIAELAYRPNLTARALRSGRTGLVSLVIPDLRSPYFAELAVAVMEAAEHHRLSVIIEQSGGDRERELQLTVCLRARSVDGILFSSLGMAGADSQFLEQASAPLVLLGESIDQAPVDHVTMHNADGEYAATAQLIKEGRRHLVALGAHPGEHQGSAALRTDGFLRAIRDAGISLDDCMIVESGLWYRSSGAEAMRQFLATGKRFDGVIAYNDSLVLGALHELQRADLHVPADVSLIGFDDIDEAGYSFPTLSTINPGLGDIATTVLQFLVERMNHPLDPRPPRQYFAPFRFVQRDSTLRVDGADNTENTDHR